MRRIAVFGNAGGGKSTLARKLADVTGLPLHVLDELQFPDGYHSDREDGGKISDEDYANRHRAILESDAWIIDGYGSLASSWERFAAADTLVYVDLPVALHYWGVTKRLGAGLFRTPPGWPDNSPVLHSSLNSYRVIGQCHARLTPKYRELVGNADPSKRVHHLKSYSDIRRFLGTFDGHSS